MKFRFPFSPQLKKAKEAITHGWKKSIEQFSFLGVWREAIGKRLLRVGEAIVRVSPPWLRAVGRFVWYPFGKLSQRVRRFLPRRPHRSFQLTRRRDYKRSLVLPGYWAFTSIVFKLLWKHKKMFGLLVLMYTVLYMLVAGVGTQDAYANLTTVLKETGSDLFTGAWGQIGQAGILLLTTFSTGLNPNMSEVQGILTVFLSFLIWLTVIWLLRNSMAGHKVRLRDGIYSSGAPIISTMLVGLVMICQLLPIALLTLIYEAASVSGLIDSGVEAMLFWAVAVLLVVLTLYWLTSTLIALVIVTLPGMYPLQAIRTAGDLVVGRRLRILYRFLWMAASVIIAWTVIMIPVILFDSWIKSVLPAISWLPLVPTIVMVMSALTLIWTSSYVYVLYRRVVDDSASPA